MIRIGNVGGAMGAAVLRDLGSLASGAMGMTGQFNAEPPSDREYGAETRKTLDAQIGNLPTAYGAEAQYQPKYGELAGNSLAQLLFGSGANLQGGLLSLLTGQLAPALRSTASADRASEVNDSVGLARSSNPGGANLIDTLVGQSQDALDNGMTAGERRDVEQSIRGGQAARGLGYGPNDLANEVFGVGMTARQLREQNLADALAAAGASTSFFGNPSSLVMRGGGVGSNAAGGAVNLAELLGQNGPRLTNPESSYASGLYGGNYAGQLGVNELNAKLALEYVKMAAAGGDSLSGMGAGKMGLV